MKNYLLLSLILLIINLKSQEISKDWANLSKYKAQNIELMKDTLQTERIVLMGDSITEGWLSFDSSFFHTNKSLINRGISGQTTQQMVLRFRQDVVNLKPQIVVIHAGTNDIAENTGPITLNEILENLKAMVELAKANKIKVILASVLPAKEFPWRKDLSPAEKIVSLNKLIEEYAISNDIVYLDYFSNMSDSSFGMKHGLSYDEVHPTLDGYKVMEPMLINAIKNLLDKK